MPKAKKAKKTAKAVKAEKAIKNACKCNLSNSCGGGVYFLGLIGALVYYISTATGFWNGVWGVIKAIVWPAFLIFDLLKFLGM